PRPRQVAAGAVRDLCVAPAAGRSRPVDLDRAAGSGGTAPPAAGLAGADADRAAAVLLDRAAARRAGRHPARLLGRPSLSRAGDGGGVAADLLHRASPGLRVLLPARAGAVADRPPRLRLPG